MEKVLLALLLGSVVITAGIQYSASSLQKGDKLHIVATSNIIADPLQSIFGDRAIIEIIIPHDTDPHSYASTLGDNEKLANADFICDMGLHFEGSLHTVIEKIAKNHPERVCIFSDALSPSEIKHEAGNPEAANPHYYLNPTLFEKAVRRAVQKIIEGRATDRVYYEGRLAQYCDGLKELLQVGKEIVEQIPEDHRIVCIDHATFEYAEKPFGFETYALKGTSMLGEHGLRDREQMTKLVIKKGLSAIFCEVSKNQKSMEAIVDDCISQKHHVVCKNVNTDALQEGKTYKNLILDNLTTIANELK